MTTYKIKHRLAYFLRISFMKDASCQKDGENGHHGLQHTHTHKKMFVDSKLHLRVASVLTFTFDQHHEWRRWWWW